MRIFEMRGSSNRIEGNALMLEHKDFTNVKNVARYIRGIHYHTVFVPLCYRESFTKTELFSIIYPNIALEDSMISELFYYD